jgi:hypothetical protein
MYWKAAHQGRLFPWRCAGIHAVDQTMSVRLLTIIGRPLPESCCIASHNLHVMDPGQDAARFHRFSRMYLESVRPARQCAMIEVFEIFVLSPGVCGFLGIQVLLMTDACEGGEMQCRGRFQSVDDSPPWRR